MYVRLRVPYAYRPPTAGTSTPLLAIPDPRARPQRGRQEAADEAALCQARLMQGAMRTGGPRGPPVRTPVAGHAGWIACGVLLLAGLAGGHGRLGWPGWPGWPAGLGWLAGRLGSSRTLQCPDPAIVQTGTNGPLYGKTGKTGKTSKTGKSEVNLHFSNGCTFQLCAFAQFGSFLLYLCSFTLFYAL